MRAAIVDASGLIVNVIVLAEDAEYTPPEGLTLVRDFVDMAEPGGSWDGNAFHPAPPPPVVSDPVAPATPTKEQLLARLAALQAQIEAVKE